MKLAQIQNKVNSLAKNWVGDKSVPAIIRGLNKAFSSSIVFFASARHTEETLPNHTIFVSGYYSPGVSGYISQHICVTLQFPNDQKKPEITEIEAKFLALNVIRTIHHEYRHKKQQKSGRGYKYTKQYPKKSLSRKHPKMAYYGNPDEVDANSYETQADSIDLNTLRKANRITWKKSEAIFTYRRYFRKNDPKVWKKFLKKVYKAHVEVQTISSRARTKKSSR
jgi:hypothetical protein